jgi:hypothetical protein
MKGFNAYMIYLALQRHFDPGSNYDYHKYHGQLKANAASFQKRKDAFAFRIIEGKHNGKTEDFILANFVENGFKGVFPQFLTRNDAEDTYTRWKKRIQSLTYILSTDLDVMIENAPGKERTIREVLFCYENQHPLLLRLLLENKINMESMIIFDNHAKFFDDWSKNLDWDFAWKSTRYMLDKYRPFIQYNREKAKKILLEKLE